MEIVLEIIFGGIFQHCNGLEKFSIKVWELNKADSYASKYNNELFILSPAALQQFIRWSHLNLPEASPVLSVFFIAAWWEQWEDTSSES